MYPSAHMSPRHASLFRQGIKSLCDFQKPGDAITKDPPGQCAPKGQILHSLGFND